MIFSQFEQFATEQAFNLMVTGVALLDKSMEIASDVAEKSLAVIVDGLFLGNETWLDKKIDDVTNACMPPQTAKVAALFIKASPFIAAGLLLPLPANVAFTVLIGSGRIYNLIQKCTEGPITPNEIGNHIKKTYNNFMNGSGIAFGIEGATQLALGMSTLSPLPILVGSTKILMGTFTLLDSGFIDSCVKSCKEVSSIIEENPEIQKAANFTKAVGKHIAHEVSVASQEIARDIGHEVKNLQNKIQEVSEDARTKVDQFFHDAGKEIDRTFSAWFNV